jgi:hypothetical protein
MSWSIDGTKWDKACFLEDPTELMGYCYTAIHFTETDILLAYSAGEYKKWHSSLERLRIRKI